MLSNVTVYEGGVNSFNLNLAKEYLAINGKLTLRELQERIIEDFHKGKTDYVYVWWVWWQSRNIRAIYEDAEGVSFVKLDNKWQLALPIISFGNLLGTQGALSQMQIPRNGVVCIHKNEEFSLRYR